MRTEEQVRWGRQVGHEDVQMLVENGRWLRSEAVFNAVGRMVACLRSVIGTRVSPRPADGKVVSTGYRLRSQG